jgi:hypothetical protein
MRWFTQPTPIYEMHDRRTIKKFLWMPVCINTEWRWLETTQILQEYLPMITDHGSGPSICDWVNVRWY